jgi:NAD(P)-dependent dehydrogenase (short-subunit alcohol dehydrogenase family)
VPVESRAQIIGWLLMVASSSGIAGEDIANAAFFLLSEESSFMTGQTVVVCGGRVMMP